MTTAIELRALELILIVLYFLYFLGCSIFVCNTGRHITIVVLYL